MPEDNTGYSKNQYDKISKKMKLSPNCPLIVGCERGKGTRWLLNQQGHAAYSSYTYDLFEKKGYEICTSNVFEMDYEVNPHLGIIYRTAEPKEFLFDVSNACPEAIYNKCDVFANSYRKYEDYSTDGKLRNSNITSKGQHYSDCPEFCKWAMEHGFKGHRSNKQSKSFSEKKLEDYLVGNLDNLESGLSYINRQVRLTTGIIDIHARDSLGNNVFIELKARVLTPSAIHKLCGQVSTYFNTINSEDLQARFFILVMKANTGDQSQKIKYGLKHWLDEGRVKLFQFERSADGNLLIFS